MAPTLLLLSFYFLLSVPFSHSTSPGNVTVVGTVFCDSCSENTFTNRSFFLQGAKVQIVCKYSSRTAGEGGEGGEGGEISIKAERTTDKFGGFKLDFPSVNGLECREGRATESFCKATLVQSPSPLCSVPSLSSSAEHFAIKAAEFNSCVYALNAISYKPVKWEASICGKKRAEEASLVTVESSYSTSAIFFWPPFFPWPCWPPFTFPSPQNPFFGSPPPGFPIPFFPLPFFAPPPPPRLPFPFPPVPFFNPLPSLYPPPSSAVPIPPPAPAYPFPFTLSPYFPFPPSPPPP